MKRIQLFKPKKVSIRFLLIGGVFFFMLGVFDLISALGNGFSMKFPDGDLMSIFFIIQGALFCIWAYSVARKSRYFISLDNQELNYLLPKQKVILSISISDIEEIKMDGIEIFILAKGSQSKARLEYIEWQELNRVKALVKDLSSRISQNNA